MSSEKLPPVVESLETSPRNEILTETSRGSIRTSIEAAQEKKLWEEVEFARKLSTESMHEKRSTDAPQPKRLTAEEAHAKRFSTGGTQDKLLAKEEVIRENSLSSEVVVRGKRASTDSQASNLEHVSMEVVVGDSDRSLSETCSSPSSCECGEEDTSDDNVTEEQDSDDDSDAVREVPADVDVAPVAVVTSDMNLLEQSELSLLGVASEEFLLEHLDSLPVEMPDPAKRKHLAVPQRRQEDEMPPQSPRLALLELNTAPLFQDPPIEQDPRLANWERWLADRKRQHRHFARDSPSLAMNCGEDVRYLKERKQVLDYARIPGPPDRYRGGPEFWRMPFFLPDRGDAAKSPVRGDAAKAPVCGEASKAPVCGEASKAPVCGDAAKAPVCFCGDVAKAPDHGDTAKSPIEEPIYAAQMTLPQKGIIPTTEYVGVPDHIRREKEVYGKLDRRSPRDIWRSNVHMRDQRTKMAARLADVETHEPDMRDLVIVGNYYQKMEGWRTRDAPVLTVSHDPGDMRERDHEDQLTASLMSMLREESEGLPKTFRALDGVACLRVQERQFYHVEPPRSRKIASEMARERLLRLYDTEDPAEFRLSFATSPGAIETKILRLENCGTVKVRYSWRRCVATPLDFPTAVTFRADAGAAQHFFFNKNIDLLLPGQVVEFRFAYRSHGPGVFRECWRLLTEPRFVDDDDVLTVHLWGVTTPHDVRDQLARLRGHVERRVQTALARDAIHAALERAKYPTYHDPPYGQNFLTEEKFSHVNPDYNFDGSLVRILCDVHDMIATVAKLPEWDFKIPTLRQIIVDHTEGEARQSHLDTLADIAMKLRRRAYVTRDGRLRKYTCVYNLLCNFANAIDREGQNLKVTYGLASRADLPPLEVKYEKSNNKRPTTSSSGTDAAVKRPKSKPKLKRGGGKTGGGGATREPAKSSRALVRDSSSSSSLSEENLPVASAAASETVVAALSASRMQSLTALFTPAAGFSESTARLLSTLTTSRPVEPVPSVPVLPIVLPANEELPATEVDEKLVRRVYRESLFVMVREALCHTVEHISAALDSYKQI